MIERIAHRRCVIVSPPAVGSGLERGSPFRASDAPNMCQNDRMKAVDAHLLELLKKSTQFVVPIYQRVYSWGDAECRRLWDDVAYAGAHDDLKTHFTGSIVYVERDEGTRTSAEPDLLIDGQQRVTTVLLILAALLERLESLPEDQREPVEGFSPAKIKNRYLMNSDEDGDRRFKLILSKSDRDALKNIILGEPIGESGSRVVRNYELLRGLMALPGTDIEQVCLGLRKLVIVDVKLVRGEDNPQKVFETMNSTGKRLAQADLIRNFVLMDLPPLEQTRLFEGYWSKMENLFSGANEIRFDEFVRHYLTLKTGAIPRLDDVYDAFKMHAEAIGSTGQTRAELVKDLHAYAARFAAMAFGTEADRGLRRRFSDLEALKATVTYPFLLRVYADYDAQLIGAADVEKILDIVISYVFRRAVCRIPTNSLNKTFAGLGSAIDPTDYVASIAARFLVLSGARRFPRDEEFTDWLTSSDLYNFKRAPYLLLSLENHGRKEPVGKGEYTIEHILPQNPDLPQAWREALGPDWEALHEKYLHTLGNLTLTGYNPEYSDRPFAQKRDMEGGFRQSPLRLNRDLGRLESWGPKEIERRADSLAKECIDLWKRPSVSKEVVERH